MELWSKKVDMVDALWIILKYQLITNETLQKYKERKAKTRKIGILFLSISVCFWLSRALHACYCHLDRCFSLLLLLLFRKWKREFDRFAMLAAFSFRYYVIVRRSSSIEKF